MWLITTLASATVATLLWYLLQKKYKLGFLSLMLWGGTIMILVDHVFGYAGGPFLEIETDGMVRNSTLLGVYMLIPVLAVWLAALFIPKLQNRFKK